MSKINNQYQCNHCKTKYTLEDAEKLLKDIKIDRSDEYDNYLTLARRAKQEDNAKNAAKYYEMVLRNNPSNWEAMFYCTYFAEISTTLLGIENSIQKMINTTSSTLQIVSSVTDVNEMNNIVSEISDSIRTLGLFYYSCIKEHYHEFDKLSDSGGEFVDRGMSIYSLEVSTGLLVEQYIGHEIIRKSCIPALFECGIEILKETFQTRWNGSPPQRISELYNEQVNNTAVMIQKYKPNYTYPRLTRRYEGSSITCTERNGKKEGCYIATSVYGYYDHPKVIILRRFRDDTLRNSFIGKQIISFYYKTSPSIIRTLGSFTFFNGITRRLLDLFVDYLTRKSTNN